MRLIDAMGEWRFRWATGFRIRAAEVRALFALQLEQVQPQRCRSTSFPEKVTLRRDEITVRTTNPQRFALRTPLRRSDVFIFRTLSPLAVRRRSSRREASETETKTTFPPRKVRFFGSKLENVGDPTTARSNDKTKPISAAIRDAEDK